MTEMATGSDELPPGEAASCIYAQVEKPRSPAWESKPELPQRTPQVKTNNHRKKAADVYENVAPPVPRKSKEARREARKYQKMKDKSKTEEKPVKRSEQTETPERKVKKKNHKPPKDMIAEREVKALRVNKDMSCSATRDQLVDGIVNGTPREVAAPQPLSKEPDSSVYELAGPLQSTYDEVEDEVKADGRTQLPVKPNSGFRDEDANRKTRTGVNDVCDNPEPCHDAVASREMDHYIYEEPIPVDPKYVGSLSKVPAKKRIITPPNTEVVDMRYYSYMCRFKKPLIDQISKDCHITISKLGHGPPTDIQLQFDAAELKHRLECQQQFIDSYRRLKEEVVIERFDQNQLRDVNELLAEVQKHYHCVPYWNDKTVELACDIQHLDGVCRLVERYKARSPVGYSVGNTFCLYLYRADITTLNVDAIANAANERLIHGAGVARAIALAAGPKLRKESDKCASQKKIQTTDVIKTTSGDLPCKAVLHAIGPRWPSERSQEEKRFCEEQLRKTYENVLEAAHAEKYRSVALPPISSGIFSVPAAVVARALKNALLNCSVTLQRTKLKEVHIVDIRDDILTLLAEEMGEDGLVKTEDGKQVSISKLPLAEVQRAIMSQSTGASKRKGKTSKWTCGLGRSKRK